MTMEKESFELEISADTAVEQFLDHTYPDSFIEWVYPNMKITD